MLSVRLGLSLFLLSGITFGQSFEVASIRPSGAKSIRGWEGGPGSKDPTRYTFGEATLLDFICTAYHIEDFQVSSKLALDRDKFDLAATIPANATEEDFRSMLRNLLAERFQMKVHMETREFPAYELSVARGGVKLGTEAAMKVASEDGFPQFAPGAPRLVVRNSAKSGYLVHRIRGQQMAVSRLAEILRSVAPGPVVDRTGLTGLYDFAMEFSSELPNGTVDGVFTSDLPDLATALKEQLGLQLVAKKLPFDVVVVEAFNRVPTEN
jgi:uncharacterized protein (TIGR03435 family)